MWGVSEESKQAKEAKKVPICRMIIVVVVMRILNEKV